MHRVKILQPLLKNLYFLGVHGSLFCLFLKLAVQTLNVVVLLHVFEVQLEYASSHRPKLDLVQGVGKAYLGLLLVYFYQLRVRLLDFWRSVLDLLLLLF